MGTTLYADTTSSSIPLQLVVDQLGVGGVPGLAPAPTVAIRNVSAGGPPFAYLDWADMTFKVAGWTTKYAAMVDVERGIYQSSLDISSFAFPLGTVLSAEYSVNASGVVGEDQDVIVLSNVQRSTAFLYKVAKNRLEEASGNPGTLTLYDDDGVTVLETWQLRDETGGAVLPAVGTPARRSAGTP